jgi:double-stranded uracil-DNA glycosylase
MKRTVGGGAAWAAGFPPVEAKRARILILGTLPGVESIRRGEYYAHPRNAFWPIMGALFGAGPEIPYVQRLRRLAAQGVLLWDVLQTTHRPGSRDAAIHPRRLVPNSIPVLLARHPELKMIAFNGGAAEALFKRHVLPACDPRMRAVPRVRLPSTSPAHAALSQARKLAVWRAALA